MNGELKHVVLKLFKRIRDTYRKQIFENFQIQHGTVIRCDGQSSRTLPDDCLTATFLCFPYLTLQRRQHFEQHTSHNYPSRSMLQTLYPFETISDRDRPPAFCRDLTGSAKAIMYVPQMWMLVVNSSKSASQVYFRDLQGHRVCDYLCRGRFGHNARFIRYFNGEVQNHN